MVLVAAFGSLRDAEVAALYLKERGVPTEPIGLRTLAPDLGPPSRSSADRRRPLVYALCGGMFTAVVGTLLWTAIAPGLLAVGWRIAITALVGASATGSIGVAAENGLDLFECHPADRAAEVPTKGEEHAVVAVEEANVRRATELLRGIGVDRILIAGD